MHLSDSRPTRSHPSTPTLGLAAILLVAAGGTFVLADQEPATAAAPAARALHERGPRRWTPGSATWSRA